MLGDRDALISDLPQGRSRMFRTIHHPRPQVKTAASALLVLLIVAAGGYTGAPALAAATTYYVDCTGGSDTNSGTSSTTAWRTLGRANQQTYGAGDQVLLKRG